MSRNAGYNKGLHFEQWLVNSQRAEGNFALRSAGSHGLVDVVIVRPREAELWMCQLKRHDRVSKPTEEFINLNIPNTLQTKKLWITKQDYQPVVYKEVRPNDV